MGRALAVSDSQVVITATPLDADYATKWTVVTTISPSEIFSVVTPK